MKQQLSRREFLHLSAAAAAGGLLAACQPQVIEKTVEVPVEKTVEVLVEKEVVVTPAPPETVELRLAEGSWVGPEGIKYWTDEVIPRFELENPYIKVTFENAESPDYADKLYTQAVAGDAPDVMFIWGNINYNLMQKGQLLALDEYFDEEFLSDFYPAKVQAHLLDGHLFGLPKYCAAICLAYNKDILDEAGVDYPDGTWDWDDYLAACEATTKRDDDGNVTQWGGYVNHEWLEPWVWMNGGEWMDAPLFGKKCPLNEEPAIEALKFLHDMIWGPNPVSPRPGDLPEFGWWNVFSTGKVALMESMSWTVTNYIRENDFHWDFTEIVTARDGTRASIVPADGYGVYTGTKDPAAAVKLIEFMVSSWAQKAGALSIVGLQPARRSAAEQWDLNSLGAQAGYDVAAYSRSMEYARLDPAFQDDEKISGEIILPVWDQIWVTGDLGLEEGIQLIVDRIDEYFANQ